MCCHLEVLINFEEAFSAGWECWQVVGLGVFLTTRSPPNFASNDTTPIIITKMRMTTLRVLAKIMLKLIVVIIMMVITIEKL